LEWIRDVDQPIVSRPRTSSASWKLAKKNFQLKFWTENDCRDGRICNNRSTESPRTPTRGRANLLAADGHWRFVDAAGAASASATATGSARAAATATTATTAGRATAAASAATLAAATTTAAATAARTAGSPATRAAAACRTAGHHTSAGGTKGMICRSAVSIENSDHNNGDSNNQEGVFRGILSRLLSPEPLEGGQHGNTCFGGKKLDIRPGKKLPEIKYHGEKTCQ
jgi:hypothetical protein